MSKSVCFKCKGKGYLRTSYMLNGVDKSAIHQCTGCNDVAAYSQAVKDQMSDVIAETSQQKIDRLARPRWEDELEEG